MIDHPQDIAAVLAYYGFDSLPDKHGWFTVQCVFHGDRRASGRVSVDHGAYNCMACPAKGDAIGLIRWKEGCDFSSAVARYESITGRKVKGVRGSTVGARGRRGFDLLGEPRSYERRRSGFSRWLRQ